MKSILWLRKRCIIAYLFSTFLFTWILWIISFTSSNSNLSTVFRMAGSLIPSFMAIFFSKNLYGSKALRDLLRQLTIWKVKPIYFLFTFCYSAVSFYIPSFICSLVGADYKITIRTEIFGFNITNPLSLLICLSIILIFGGPLGEEIGWRGFVLPRLKEKYGLLSSGIIIGIIWTCWHIPMFLFHIEGYNNFIIYLIQTISLSIIYTWLYYHVKGSLLIVILYHTIDNFIPLICFPQFLNNFNMYSIVYWVVQSIVVLCIIFNILRKH